MAATNKQTNMSRGKVNVANVFTLRIVNIEHRLGGSQAYQQRHIRYYQRALHCSNCHLKEIGQLKQSLISFPRTPKRIVDNLILYSSFVLLKGLRQGCQSHQEWSASRSWLENDNIILIFKFRGKTTRLQTFSLRLIGSDFLGTDYRTQG